MTNIPFTIAVLAGRVDVSDVSPAQFLHSISEKGESYYVCTHKYARKPFALFTNLGFNDLSELDHLKDGHDGVWFLSNPVTGEPVLTEDKNEWFPNGEKWRTEDNVTAGT